MSYILKIYQLTKSFEDSEVVSGVNIHVKKGEIYGLLGPNGAGKTTIMRMIMNLIKPKSGEIEIFGEKLTNRSFKLLKRMRMINEYSIFYEELTAQENLYLHCEYMGYYDKNSINHALDLVKLNNIENKKVKDFSLGMKKRLGIARAITTKPELLVVDEPFNGLDSTGVKVLKNLFKMLCKEYGITLLISSHILAELEQISDTIGIIQSGKLLEEVSVKNIKEERTEYIEVIAQEVKKAVFILDYKLGLINYKIMNERTIRIYEMKEKQQEILRALIMSEIKIESINKRYSSLEESLLNIMNEEGIIS